MRDLKVVINFDKLNTNYRKEKAKKVQKEMEVVLNSDIFYELFIMVLINNNYYNGELSTWKGKSPDELYTYLMSGSEVLDTTNDGEINIDVDDYYTFKRVIGYTTKNSPTIYTNTKYYDNRTSKLIGSNFLHEYGHKLGFSHDFYSTDRRKYSLCYLLNIIYEKAHSEIYKTPRKYICTRSFKNLFMEKCYWVDV